MWDIRTQRNFDSVCGCVRVFVIEMEKLVPVHQPFAGTFIGLPRSVPSHSAEHVGETQRERKTRQNGAEANECRKDFMPPLRLRSSPVCSVWLGGKWCAGPMSYWHTDAGSRRCTNNLSSLDALRFPPSSLLARHLLTLPEQIKIRWLQFGV